MSTRETDLRDTDQSLLGMIDLFAEELGAKKHPIDEATGSRGVPFSLAGYADFLLAGRCELTSGDKELAWIVQAESMTNARTKPVEFRYLVDSKAIGDVYRDRARCEWRLKKLAEAHLRAHLHMLKFDLSSFSVESTFHLDAKGRLLDS